MFHEGVDRIELAPELGRPLRQGSFEALAVSDLDFLRQAVAARDPDLLQQRCGYLGFGHTLMVGITREWAQRWGEHETEAVGFLEAVREEQRELAERVACGEQLEPDGFAAVLEAAAADDWEKAAAALETSFGLARDLHDLYLLYAWTLMNRFLARHGQNAYEETMTQTLRRMSFYEAAWKESAGLRPEQLAVVLAEHLRLHFTGPDGQGQVHIEETPHAYRLRLDGCGSGGRMRRAVQGRPGFEPLPQASGLTWGRSGQVPTYCAHCALNERESLDRMGRLLWVTEFDPDPARPCAWTIYKDPEKIPPALVSRPS